MRRARTGLLALGLLLATLPAQALADKDNTPSIGVKDLDFTCSASSTTVNYSFKAQNGGDAPGTFDARLKVLSGPTRKEAKTKDPLFVELGQIDLDRSQVKLQSGSFELPQPANFVDVQARLRYVSNPSLTDKAGERHKCDA